MELRSLLAGALSAAGLTTLLAPAVDGGHGLPKQQAGRVLEEALAFLAGRC